MEAPEYVIKGLRDIRQDLEIRWNPTARLAKPGHIDATGTVVQPMYEGRFEVWEKPDAGPEAKVMTLENPDGSFRAPGQWLIDWINRINPANWGGDPNKMLAYFVDHADELRENVSDKDFDDFAESVAKWAGWRRLTKSKLPQPAQRGLTLSQLRA